MRRPALSVVALIVLAAGVSLILGLPAGHPPIDWFFLTIVLSAALLVGRACWLAFRAAGAQRKAAAGLDALDPLDVARHAVIGEHRRLARDIEASLRDSLATVGRLATDLDDGADPRPRMAAIRAEAVRATTDLRRQLGLLRAEEALPSVEPMVVGDPSGRLRRGDWLLTAAVVVVAVAELTLLAPLEDLVPTSAQTAISLAAAATVLGRRLVPEIAGLACAGILALGALVDQPVLDGFWLGLTVGVLGWSCAALATSRAWLVVLLLMTCAVWSRLLNHPENAGILVVTYCVAVVGGATFGRSRRRLNDASVRADVREGELRAAAAEAVSAERRMMARELHDVVSHAVSVIAVQAGAAELCWPTDPVTARRSMNIIVTVAEQTIAELDRLLPGRPSPSHSVADLFALADRMRAAGLEVRLDLSAEPSSPVPETVYRVVQEALTNALRHAPGSSVAIQIDRRADCITVTVVDDGPGSAADSRRGYGLIGLAERVRQAGGTLTIRSTPEDPGFQVTAVLPDRASVETP